MADMFECSNNLAPLGSARGALWSAQTVRRAKPRREIQCIYTHPSAPLGVQPSASLGVQCSALNGVPLGSARGATLGFARGATLGSAQTVRRAKPRREIQCIYLHPSASLGVHSASLKLFVERSRDEKSNAYTSTPRLRSGCTRLRSGCTRLCSGCTRLCSGCNLKEIPIVLGNVVFTPISLHILPNVCT
jgi:hypothetical protein